MLVKQKYHNLKQQPDIQQHLNYQERVNLGSYYTDNKFVDIVWQMIEPNLRANTVILDSSCGYGNFLKVSKPYQKIGVDIDATAIEVAKQKYEFSCYVENALDKVDRKKYQIKTQTIYALLVILLIMIEPLLSGNTLKAKMFK